MKTVSPAEDTEPAIERLLGDDDTFSVGARSDATLPGGARSNATLPDEDALCLDPIAEVHRLFRIHSFSLWRIVQRVCDAYLAHEAMTSRELRVRCQDRPSPSIPACESAGP